MFARPSLFAYAACSIPPHDFIPEILNAKYGIHNKFQIMAGSRVAMQINAAGRFQHAAHCPQSEYHIYQIGRQT